MIYLIADILICIKGLLLFLFTTVFCFIGAPIQMVVMLVGQCSFSHYYIIQSFLLGLQYRLMQFIFEKIQGANVTYSGDKLDSKEPALILSNHQSSTDLYMIGALGWQLDMIGNSRYFMKDSIKYIPVFGWGLWMTGQFFMKRNWAQDKELINRTFDKIIRLKLPVWIVSYPEGTRFSPKKKLESQEFSESRGKPLFENTLFPRTKGSVATIQKLRDSHVRYVYDVTIAYRKDVKYDGFGKTLGAFKLYFKNKLSPQYRFHIHVDKFLIDDLPSDDEQLSDWVIQRFQNKDKLLESLKTKAWTDNLPSHFNCRSSPL